MIDTLDFVSDTVRVIHINMMNEIKNCKQKSKSTNSCYSRILFKNFIYANFLKILFFVTGGMPLWLSVLTAFSKDTLLDDPGSIPSTCMAVYNCVTPLTGDLTKYQCT